MNPLVVKGKASSIHSPVVGIVGRDPSQPNTILCIENTRVIKQSEVMNIKGMITSDNEIPSFLRILPKVSVESLPQYTNGDIVVLWPQGNIETVYRTQSDDNSLFVTKRCNSNCLMCSQPPQNVDDIEDRFQINTQLIPLIPKYTNQIGITGGEPTLLGWHLVKLIEQLRDELPETMVHILTNGRAFAWRSVVEDIAEIMHPKLVLGVPLYSDFQVYHDYIVQTQNAFAQTVLGLHNLARYHLNVELRIVIHKQNYERMPQMAEFIFRNFPFVEHIAFMGLEYTGYVPYNHSLLWIDPMEYQRELSKAAHYLSLMNMVVSIYNIPLCLLPRDMWIFCQKSISDWKRMYFEECERCIVRGECGGVFGTSRMQSSNIHAL